MTVIGNGNLLEATFSSAVEAGDLLVCIVRASGTVSVSDNVNGSWTQINSIDQKYLFFLQNSRAANAGSLVITLVASSSNDVRISADEFSGVATSSALDAQSTGTVSQGTAWSAGSTSSIPAGELVYAGAGTGSDEVFSVGSTNGIPMTVGGRQTSSSNGAIFSEYVLSSAAGVQNADATMSPSVSSEVSGGQATFRP